MKRLTSVFCCLAMCCALVGCNRLPTELSDEPVSDTPSIVADDTARLAFNREDALHPYKAQTALNISLTPLLYDSLVTVDAQFMPQDSMAKVVQTDPTHLQATLKDNLKFSNGKTVNTADVLYALDCAKASAVYKTRVENIASAKVKGDTIIFTLKQADVDAKACLNFPIIPKGADDNAPAGSGRYVYNSNDNTLNRNPHVKAASDLKTISLTPLVSESSVLQALENGSIHYMYNDLSDGNIPRTSLQDKTVDLTQLVFIGANRYHPLLSTTAYRKAISAAIDRTAIAAAAYAGRALPATSPFHPKWQKTEKLTCIAGGAKADGVQALMAQAQASAATITTTTAQTAGTTVNSTAAATTITAQKAEQTFSLIYPVGNNCREAAVKMLTSQLSAAGITVIPTPLPYDTYTSRLQTGDFELYLGEIRLTANMDLSPLLLSGGAAVYGTDTATPATAAYTAYKSGSESAAKFITTFGEQMPYIPLLWKQGMAAYAKPFAVTTPLMYDIFNGV